MATLYLLNCQAVVDCIPVGTIRTVTCVRDCVGERFVLQFNQQLYQLAELAVGIESSVPLIYSLRKVAE
jgi:hypothetical protein